MLKIIKISDILKPEYIIDIKSADKNGALQELLDVICQDDTITDEKAFRKAIFEREQLMSTGIGFEIAIPHARHPNVKDFVMAIGRKKGGIPYASIDDKPVKLIIMIGASDKQDKDYIRLLSRLMLRLKNQRLMRKILKAPDPADIYHIIKKQP